MAGCLIALGANLGDAEQTLQAVLAHLARLPQVRQLVASRIYTTAPIGGPPGQPPFANAAARFETDLSPLAVLALLQSLEHQWGRERVTFWGPRTLDLDLLLYDEQRIDSPILTVPHPRMAMRRFVLEPAVEIAPLLRHPTSGLPLQQLWDHVNSAPLYVALSSACWFAKMHVATTTVERLMQQKVVATTTTMRGMTVWGPPPVSDPEHSFVEHYCDLLPRLAEDLQSLLAGAPACWLISGFWPAEVRLGGELWFTGEARNVALAAYDRAFATVPAPRLIAFLETPNDLLLLNPDLASQDERYRDQAQRLASQRDALTQLIEKTRGTPVLRLSAARPEAAIEEVSAAVLAMR